MPRVLPQINGFDVKVNRDEDQDEPHVHVYKSGVEYRVSIVTGTLLTATGGTAAQAKAAVRLVREHLNECRMEWNKWHNTRCVPTS